MSGFSTMANTPLACVATRAMVHPRLPRKVLSNQVELLGFTIKLRCSKDPSAVHCAAFIYVSHCSEKRKLAPAGVIQTQFVVPVEYASPIKCSLGRQSRAAWQLALVTNIHNGSIRHSDRLPGRIRNSGYPRGDG